MELTKFDLWFEHFNQIDEEGRQLLPIKPVYYLDPNEVGR